MQTTSEVNIMTAKDVTDLTGITIQTLRKQYKQGKFPKPTKIGKKEFWHKDIINQFLRGK
ncbi:helix-turn-helix transcriptional regulator [Gallibacterium salpingitidis]|uniref:Helix-turn-helix domain-containing protein n=1 Tax=Gallibacterium salpingitidis TaxID=505341 RepID=A0A1A7NZR2_9PAST|nr:helix-turn-helix domain-containing protein [Gallibacterium salpingitidis]OBW95203.1 hypothetical protein QS62_04240 [Gallibacterium salpingitidis]